MTKKRQLNCNWETVEFTILGGVCGREDIKKHCGLLMDGFVFRMALVLYYLNFSKMRPDFSFKGIPMGNAISLI